jgi:hypothetical protein
LWLQRIADRHSIGNAVSIRLFATRALQEDEKTNLAFPAMADLSVQAEEKIETAFRRTNYAEWNAASSPIESGKTTIQSVFGSEYRPNALIFLEPALPHVAARHSQ